MKSTQKAIKLSLLSVAMGITLTGSVAIKADIHQDTAYALIKPFFTESVYNKTMSFQQLCGQVADHLERSSDKEDHELAKVLKTIGNEKNPLIIGMKLKQFSALLKKAYGDKVLPQAVLLKRLKEIIA